MGVRWGVGGAPEGQGFRPRLGASPLNEEASGAADGPEPAKALHHGSKREQVRGGHQVSRDVSQTAVYPTRAGWRSLLSPVMDFVGGGELWGGHLGVG